MTASEARWSLGLSGEWTFDLVQCESLMRLRDVSVDVLMAATHGTIVRRGPPLSPVCHLQAAPWPLERKA